MEELGELVLQYSESVNAVLSMLSGPLTADSSVGVRESGEGKDSDSDSDAPKKKKKWVTGRGETQDPHAEVRGRGR